MSRLTRADVIQAAMDLLETGGVAALTIPAVALKLNIRPPSLYNHIESMSDLKRELSIRGMRQICQVWSSAVEGKTGQDALVCATAAYRKFAREHSALYALSLVVPPASDEEWSKAFKDFLPLWMELFLSFGLDPLHARYAARALRCTVHGFVDLEINGGLLEDVDLEESFQSIVSTLISCLHSSSVR